MDSNGKNQVADLVQAATAEALQKLTCPSCAGGLQVQFVPKGRRGRGAGTLYVTCAQCRWRVISDGLSAAPPWVNALGPKIQTAQKQVG